MINEATFLSLNYIIRKFKLITENWFFLSQIWFFHVQT